MSDKKGNYPFPPSAPPPIVFDPNESYIPNRPPPPSYDESQKSRFATNPNAPPSLYPNNNSYNFHLNNTYGYGQINQPVLLGHTNNYSNPSQYVGQPMGPTLSKGVPVVEFAAGARFNGRGNGSITVPPPPPGCAATPAQIAALQGQPVILKKKKNTFF